MSLGCHCVSLTNNHQNQYVYDFTVEAVAFNYAHNWVIVIKTAALKLRKIIKAAKNVH